MQNTFCNLSLFLMEVNALFGAGMPTSEEVRLRLVPKGTINTATPGQFGPSGIYKYKFNLDCGATVTVKCHLPQSNAAGGITCNSYCHPTAQLYVCSDGYNTDYVVWDNSNKRAILKCWNDWKMNEEFINWSHIPVLWDSTPTPGQPSV